MFMFGCSSCISGVGVCFTLTHICLIVMKWALHGGTLGWHCFNLSGALFVESPEEQYVSLAPIEGICLTSRPMGTCAFDRWGNERTESSESNFYTDYLRMSSNCSQGLSPRTNASAAWSLPLDATLWQHGQQIWPEMVGKIPAA